MKWTLCPSKFAMLVCQIKRFSARKVFGSDRSCGFEVPLGDLCKATTPIIEGPRRAEFVDHLGVRGENALVSFLIDSAPSTPPIGIPLGQSHGITSRVCFQ
jgi:hypothetical protein